jgi:hypothetical protein
MAEFIAELENMAANTVCTIAEESLADDTKRWQTLFGFSGAQAVEQIHLHRNNMARSKVSDELWSIVQKEQEAQGFDRDSYEYALTNGVFMRKPLLETTTSRHHSSNTTYIVKIDGPISSADRVKEVTQLSHTPEIARGTGEAGDAVFCKIDGTTRQKLIAWLGKEHPSFRPTIIRLSKSPKHLSSYTMAPLLGKDTTLPQHRPNHANFTPLPSEDQYPVWYFFYGNLAKPTELQQRLNLVELPSYTPASIQGGKIKSWRGQFKALVEADDAERYESGSAYLVRSREEEEILQFYETEKYEVVRCIINMEGGSRNVNGLVFRFAGSEAELQ